MGHQQINDQIANSEAKTDQTLAMIATTVQTATCKQVPDLSKNLKELKCMEAQSHRTDRYHDPSTRVYQHEPCNTIHQADANQFGLVLIGMPGAQPSEAVRSFTI